MSLYQVRDIRDTDVAAAFTLRALGKVTVKGTSHYAVTKKTIDHKGYEGSQRNSLRESFV